MRLNQFLVGVLSFFLVVCAAFVPMAVQGQESGPGESKRWERPGQAMRVGLIVGGASAEVERWKGDFHGQVEAEGGLFVQVVNAVSGPEERELLELFQLQERGQEAYFYQGPRAARELLAADVLGYLETSHNWMIEPKGGEALMMAGLFLLRAARDLGDEELVTRVLKALVEALPGHQVHEELFPPDIVALVEQARAELAREHETKFSIVGMEQFSEGCRALINGAPIEGEGVFIAPDRGYLVGYSCSDGSQTRAWWHRARAGQRKEVVLFHEALDPSVLASELSRRRRAGDFQALVYIGPGACDAEVCVATKIRGRLEREISIRPLESFRPAVILEGASVSLQGR